MNFAWSEEQLALGDATVRFAERALNTGLAQRDRNAEFSTEGWGKCAEFGIQGVAVPEHYGGGGHDPLTAALLMESLGYGCRDNGLLFALGAQMWGVQMPILLFGNEHQKEWFLSRLVKGERIGALAVTEPAAGSDAFSLQTTAVREGRTYLLTGSKTFVTNATHADVFLVLATLDPAKGPTAVTAFLVDRQTQGLSVGPPMGKMGLRTSTMAEVVFDHCPVPEDQMLGPEGAGVGVFTTAMEWERTFILAPAIGSMQRQLEESTQYSRSRRQFGMPIGKNQAVAGKLVDMQIRLETARLLIYRTAWMKSDGKRLTREPSEVKLHASESWVQNCLDALQIHGGYGYITDTGIERNLRDALASKIYSGTSEIQKVIIAGYLGV